MMKAPRPDFVVDRYDELLERQSLARALRPIGILMLIAFGFGGTLAALIYLID